MPGPPSIAAASQAISGAVYSSMTDLLDGLTEIYPLHVGDTYLLPASPGRCWQLPQREDLHRYTPTAGLPELRAALANDICQRTAVDLTAEQVYVTAGTTPGLKIAMQALVEPGEDVLILAPYWPLIEGIARACGARPRPVPVENAIGGEALLAALEGVRTESTTALYFSSPNNPSGRVFDEEEIEALVAFARRHQLWLLADDVYDRLCFDSDHTSTLGRAPEQTVVFYSASKAYAMAGNRCGWLVAPEPAMAAIQKIGIHTFYSAPTSSQIAVLQILESPDDWLQETRSSYRDTAEKVARRLGVPIPQGGTFLFFDVEHAIGEDGLEGFLRACAEHNLLLAPGPSFGPYPTHVRLCFTACRPDVVLRGVEVLARLIDERQGARRHQDRSQREIAR